ncbi:MAG: hypothetical protein QG591_583, partial [Planctomycetota bacterium]|nr:hypothetical protein [Planctomycetota bacterium]
MFSRAILQIPHLLYVRLSSRRSLMGTLYAIHRITRLNKMKIPIQ